MSDLAEQLLEALGLVRRHARRRVERPWPLESLTNAQLELVRVVRRQPGISVAGAAAELGVAANTVSTLVGSLVESGTLRREPHATDRRIARLYLTDNARRRVDRWRDERATVLSDTLAAMDDDDRSAIAGALPSLVRLADRLRLDGSA